MVAITKPTVGGDTDTWGTKLNTALDTLATAVTTLETGGSGIPASTIGAKGDLIIGTAASAVTRLPVGLNGYTLQANNAQTNGLWWGLTPGTVICKLRATSTQSISNSTYTNLAFQTADIDRSSTFSSGNTTFTPGLAGWYELTGGVSFTSSTTGYRASAWAVSGSQVQGSGASMGNHQGAIAENLVARPTIVQLGATDNVSLQAWHSNGASLSTYAVAPSGSTLQIKWLGY